MTKYTVIYNSLYSSKEDQETLNEGLPMSHEFGDKHSVLKTGQIINGSEHDLVFSHEFRVKTRKRCTIMNVVATHAGSGTRRVKIVPTDILVCFNSIADWQGPSENFLVPATIESIYMGPRIGTDIFLFNNFIKSIFQDLLMCFNSLRASMSSHGLGKLHLKIVPLGVGPTIRNKSGLYLGPLIIPAYLLALEYACLSTIDESWIDTLEFVDHTQGQLSPRHLYLKNIQIISGARDVFDFSACTSVPSIICPCDSFCTIGGRPEDKHISVTMANNSDIRETIAGRPQFVAWTSKI